MYSTPFTVAHSCILSLHVVCKIRCQFSGLVCGMITGVVWVVEQALGVETEDDVHLLSQYFLAHPDQRKSVQGLGSRKTSTAVGPDAVSSTIVEK